MTLFERYFDILRTLSAAIEATGPAGVPLAYAAACDRVIALARAAHAAGCKLMFIGNGGSAGIASHLAIDCSKNGGIRAMAFNDAAALTCVGNDLGYDQVFAQQVAMLGAAGDVLVAISSSGRSPNILAAAAAARRIGCTVITLSGFSPDNPLRGLGDINFHVASDQYGLVEVMHMTILHAILDVLMGWRGQSLSDQPMTA